MGYFFEKILQYIKIYNAKNIFIINKEADYMTDKNNIREHDTKTKSELANEMGIPIPKDGYWGNMTSRVCGTVGGAIGGNEVRNAVEQFEKKLIKK
jgi:hypothetical protein